LFYRLLQALSRHRCQVARRSPKCLPQTNQQSQTNHQPTILTDFAANNMTASDVETFEVCEASIDAIAVALPAFADNKLSLILSISHFFISQCIIISLMFA
jgi:hypothetical protein